jgi:hypothetical protein
MVTYSIDHAGSAESDEVCKECSGLKVKPCEKCSSKSLGELYDKLKKRAEDGDINVPVLARTSSFKQ